MPRKSARHIDELLKFRSSHFPCNRNGIPVESRNTFQPESLVFTVQILGARATLVAQPVRKSLLDGVGFCPRDPGVAHRDPLVLPYELLDCENCSNP